MYRGDKMHRLAWQLELYSKILKEIRILSPGEKQVNDYELIQKILLEKLEGLKR